MGTVAVPVLPDESSTSGTRQLQKFTPQPRDVLLQSGAVQAGTRQHCTGHDQDGLRTR